MRTMQFVYIFISPSTLDIEDGTEINGRTWPRGAACDRVIPESLFKKPQHSEMSVLQMRMCL